jgi:hypothetical protein
MLSVEKLRELRIADEDARCEKLLVACVALENLEQNDKPEWNPPGIEDKQTTLDGARFLLSDVLEHQEAYDWDEARVWRELYEHTFGVADRLREIAQKLDDFADAEIKLLEEHNAEIDELNAQAKRLQADLGL